MEFSAQLSDNINLAKKTSVARVWNAVKLIIGYEISKLTKKPFMWGMPASVSIEPTTSCNLRCPECPSGLRSFTRATGALSPTYFDTLLNQLGNTLYYLTFYFQGEPYLNPAFLGMVKAANKRKIYTATSTNAHYLTPEVALKTVDSGLDRLIISVDGTTQDVYQQYRVGGNLAKVIEGTKNIVEAKKTRQSKTPFVIFQFLVVKPNEHQLDDVLKLAKDLGVDHVAFKTAQVYDFKNGNVLIPDNPKYSRYKLQTDGTYAIKNNLLSQCWRMWQGCVITWDGKVVPCCFDKDATHTLGKVNDTDNTSFRSIWHGNAYKTFRGAILKGRDQIDICTNCTEGTKVWA